MNKRIILTLVILIGLSILFVDVYWDRQAIYRAQVRRIVLIGVELGGAR